MHHVYALLLALSCAATLRAQTVPNTCATAVPIVPPAPSEDCEIGTSFELELAGTTASGKTSSCVSGGQVDQWFTWTATTDGLTWSPYNRNISIAVYDACDTDTPLDCSRRRSARQRLYGWDEGDELLIQIATSSGSDRIVFCLQEYDTPPPPANDDCAGAQATTIGDDVCGQVVTASTVGATLSDVLGIECSLPSGTFGRDLWYSFVPTTAKARIDVRDAGANTIPIAGEVYIGAADGSRSELTVAQCAQYLNADDPNNLSGLVPGRRHYLRVFSPVRDVEGDFSFCLVGAPPAPANDECVNAVNVTLGDQSPGPQLTGNTFAATSSASIGRVCWGVEGDLWYRFTADQPNVFLVVDEPNEARFILNGRVLADDCAEGTQTILCESSLSGRTTRFSGLRPGTTYLLHFSSSDNSFQGPFTFAMYNDGPAPANDRCAGAEAVTVGETGTCGPVVQASGRYASASPSETSCNARLNNFNDLWYAFTPTYNNVDLNVSELTTLGQATYNQRVYLEVYTGACGALASAQCPLYLNEGASRTKLFGLTPGQTHYLRFFTGTGSLSIDQLAFCLQDGPAPPDNDAYTDALPVTLGSGSCGPEVTATLTSATNGVSVAAKCTQFADSPDVWYRFTPVGSRAFFTTTAEDRSLGSTRFDVFAKAANGPGEKRLCSGSVFTDRQVTIEGLAPGEEHYLRFYSDNPAEGTATFCMFDDFPPPANDECATATVITPGEADAPAVVSATFSGATASADVEGQCRGVRSGGLSYYNSDIWFRFTAERRLVRMALNSSDVGFVFEMYRGGDCASLTPLNCDSDLGRRILPSFGALDLYDLEVGEEYTLRFYQQNGSTPGDVEFRIWQGPEPPTNDECADAITLPVSADGCLSPVTGDNTSASDSAPAGVECSTNDLSYRYDVWYAFTPTTKDVYVSFPESFYRDMRFEIYTSTDCTDFALANCDADQNSSTDQYRLRNLQAGQRYLMRVYTPTSNFSSGRRYGEFSVCLQPPGTPPANEECASAKPLDVALGRGAAVLDTGTTAFATGTGLDFVYNGNTTLYGGGEVYYKVIAPRSGAFEVTVRPLRNTFDHVFGVYDGCGPGATQLAAGLGGNSSPPTQITGLAPGQEVYIAVFPQKGQGEGAFTISAVEQVPAIATGILCNELPFVFVNGGDPGRFVDVLTAQGRIVASIEDRYDLGQVDVSHYGNPDPGLRRNDIFPDEGLTTDRSVSIVPRVQPSGPIRLRLYFTVGEVEELLNQVTDGSELRDLLVARLPDGVCSAEPSGAPTFSRADFLPYDNGYRLEVTVPGFSEFFVVAPGNAPVPVTLTSFEAAATDCNTVLATWRAESEDDFDAYAVETSPDGARWTAFAKTAPTPSRQYAAEVPAAGATTYVRLRMDDLDGTMTYSQTRVATSPCAPVALRLSPNPAVAGLGTRVEAPAGASVRVVDALGRVVVAFGGGAGDFGEDGATYDIPAGTLSAGTYVVVAGAQTARLVVR